MLNENWVIVQWRTVALFLLLGLLSMEWGEKWLPFGIQIIS